MCSLQYIVIELTVGLYFPYEDGILQGYVIKLAVTLPFFRNLLLKIFFPGNGGVVASF